MVTRDELIQKIHHLIGEELVEKANKLDENANGVQIHGAEKVTKIALGVSTSLDFFQEAAASGAQFCLTHHGIHLSSRYLYNARLDQSQQNILKYVFAHNLTVAGYHYTLDVHPEIGNNATIINLLGAKRLEIPYFEGWGWVGEFEKPQDVKKLADKLAKITSHDVFAVYGGKSKVKRVGVCSGGAKPTGITLHEIYEKGIELHIAGEIAEGGPGIAKDAEFNYFSAGHYATEVFGVQELGKKLKSHYGNKLEVEFIDIPNPL
ncbi:MAG: Nif3-like dinuclear metal center hexameric protein [bacterium]